MKNKVRKYFCRTILLFSVLVVVLLLRGIIWIGEPSLKKYPIRGVDVSHYQGKIDWSIISKQNITFAFIKATEGSNSYDEYFADNWRNIELTDIRRGAYHFFSFDSPGKSQAENFISVVPISDSMLPPIVDIEFYGNKEKNKPNKNKVRKELDVLLNNLENYYGKKPIIYTTMKVYQLYIDDYYDSYPLWIRNTYYKPFLINNRTWLFWQYSDKKVLDGYYGNEKYIDMNIFNGDLKSFKDLYY